MNITVQSLLALVQQMAYHSYEALQDVEHTCLTTPAGRRALAAAKQSTFHANRICNILNYILDKEDNSVTKKFESFEIKSMMEEIIFRFESIVSTFNNVSVSFKFELEDDSLITVSKTHFELIILNLLYCTVKTNPQSPPQSIKISVSVTENKDYIVFHIHDNNKYPDDCHIQDVLSAPFDPEGEIDLNSVSGMIEISARAAQKSAHELDGKLAYASLKGGNRYDVYLPKLANVPSYSLFSTVRYTATHSLLNEIFADLRYAYILSVKEEDYNDQFKGVVEL